MVRSDDAALPARVRDLVTPVAEELGIDLVDVELKGQRGSHVVRLIADTVDPSEALDIDRIATLSRRAGDVLEQADPLPGAYTLEVTSPGATRPLRGARDFARHVGRDVEVLRLADLGDPRTLRGTVTDVDDDAVTLERDGTPVRVPLEEVDHGTVILPW